MKTRKLPKSHWAIRGEKAFRKTVAEEIRRHHDAGHAIHVLKDGKVVAIKPTSSTATSSRRARSAKD